MDLKSFKSNISYSYVTIFLIACSMLIFEILLTRICALRLFFHFGFLVVSNCLLGVGASGTMVYLLQDRLIKRQRFWIWIYSILYLISLGLAYLFLLTFDIGTGVNFNSLFSMVRFTVFNLVAAVPFFFAGAVIGMLLTFNARDVNKIYGVDLLGAGLGCLLCPFFLWQTGAGGCIVLVMLLALGAVAASVPPQYKRVMKIAGVALGVIGLSFLPVLDKQFPVPSKNEVFVTGKVGIEFRDSIVYSRWSATSRVDLVNLDRKHRFILGLGEHSSKGAAIPEEKWIMQDGSAGTYILNFSQYPFTLETLRRSLYSTAYILKEEPRVFVIGVGGGNDVWAAKANNASYIKGIELNEQILYIHRKVLPHYSSMICNDPGIDLVFDEGRSALMREKEKYDVIQMSGVDTWTSLTSGAYILAENYLYTTDAIRLLYENLNEGGLIAMTRFAAEMETTRLFSNIFAGLEGFPGSPGDLEKSTACIGHGVLRTILVKKGVFTKRETQRLEDFCEKWGFTFVYHPFKRLGNPVETFVRTEDKASFIRSFPRDISPTSDDRPYFFNFSKWSRLFTTTRHIHEPTAVSQGNPFFIFLQLLVSAILAIGFILVPVAVFTRKTLDRKHLWRFLIYFSGLGVGFIAIEIVLMQKLVLFLGHPLHSITVTLFALLVFAGLGSFLSQKWFHSPTPKIWWVMTGLVGYVVLFITAAKPLTELLIVLPQYLRIILATGALAPIGLLLGVPFAYGIRLLNRFNPTIIPWAWAVNGSMTVIGSILAVILSMNLGFNVVMVTSVLIYLVSFTAVNKFYQKVGGTHL